MLADFAGLAMASCGKTLAQVLRVRISSRRAMCVFNNARCQQHETLSQAAVALQREAMLTTTLSGEPGTLRRFAEAAVAGTRLNITELRHRRAVAPCRMP